MYATGRGGLHGKEKAIKVHGVLEKNMTPAQIAKAQRLAREWKAKGK